MDQVPQSSFVPRQAGNTVVQAPLRRRRRFNLLSFFAVVLFFSSLILAVAVFALRQSSIQTLEERRTELSSKRALFNREDIESVQLMDVRLKAASALLESHVSPSKLLEVLERSTQEEIQYTSFVFTRRPSGNVGVAMDGIAPRFNTIASQAQRFADERIFRRVIFSDLNKPAPQYVSFSVNVDIAKDQIAYEAPQFVEVPVEEVSVDSSSEMLSSEDLPMDGEPVETPPSLDPL